MVMSGFPAAPRLSSNVQSKKFSATPIPMYLCPIPKRPTTNSSSERTNILAETSTSGVSGFRRQVDENCALLGCYAASSGNSLQMDLRGKFNK
jgi:hypothetical protein